MSASRPPWPCVPRPFADEAFGSWIGRVAGRYRISVDELAQAAGVFLDFGAECSTWLIASPPAESELDRLSRVSGISTARLAAMRSATSLTTRVFRYCFHCLFLNPVEVESPYWHARWLEVGSRACTHHPDQWEQITQTALRQHRNMAKLTRFISRRHAYRMRQRWDTSVVFSYASIVRRRG